MSCSGGPAPCHGSRVDDRGTDRNCPTPEPPERGCSAHGRVHAACPSGCPASQRPVDQELPVSRSMTCTLHPAGPTGWSGLAGTRPSCRRGHGVCRGLESLGAPELGARSAVARIRGRSVAEPTHRTPDAGSFDRQLGDGTRVRELGRATPATISAVTCWLGGRRRSSRLLGWASLSRADQRRDR